MPPKKTTAPSKQPSKKKQTGDTQKPFDFPGLPAELRNEIYALVCGARTKAYLSARTHGNLTSPLTLLRANHQLRREGTHILSLVVPEIVATVKDLDFGHIITFFNRCEDIQLDKLGKSLQDSDDRGRKMVVKLKLTETSHYFVDRLQRWINRFGRPAKRGTGVAVEYRVVYKSREHVERFKGIVRHMQGWYENERQLGELQRMLAASR